ncbi:DUF2164 domain-containing protein [Bacillus sp. SL00103]
MIREQTFVFVGVTTLPVQIKKRSVLKKKAGDNLKPLTKEEKSEMMIAIQRFFAEEREEEIGSVTINILNLSQKTLEAIIIIKVRDSGLSLFQRSQLLEGRFIRTRKR